MSLSPNAVRRANSPSIWENEDRHRNRSETMPLVEPKSAPPAPTAGPEIDDLEDDVQTSNKPFPGIDDGFFAETDNTDAEHIPREIPDLFPRIGGDDVPDFKPNNVPTESLYPDRPAFPYAPGFGPNSYRPDTEFGGIPDLESIPDVNVYQHKKTLAQGMMDLALFSANANQLRYVVESSSRHPYYYPSIVMIALSLFLQVAIGVGLIWNSRYNVKDEKEICIANKINNYTVIGIFIVTSINVFISAFGVASAPAATTP